MDAYGVNGGLGHLCDVRVWIANDSFTTKLFYSIAAIPNQKGLGNFRHGAATQNLSLNLCFRHDTGANTS